MSCTTILVGKDASYNGCPLIARNEDSPSGEFTPKRFCVVEPTDQPRHYKSVCSHVEIDLPDNPLRYTACPDASGKDGIWAEAGINEANVSMSATETLTSNARVLGADPLVELKKAQGAPEDDNYIAEQPGGIGEEDMVTLVLPYITSAREGVIRLGNLLETYGTYEMNGIAFADADEIWWLETVGGHHWMARRVPDDCYVTMPNQLGLDNFDIHDALGEQKEHMCSADLDTFIQNNHLDVSLTAPFNPRHAFGSNNDADRVYNTPRAWYMQRTLNPHSENWDSPYAEHTPESDTLPWARTPEKKITIEDIKYVLSSHYQGTPYDPYGHKGDSATRNMYRPIGINRQSELALLEVRKSVNTSWQSVEWLTFGSNAFNTIIPLYTNIHTTPEYLNNTTMTPTTENFYWANRMLAALADKHFDECAPLFERYEQAMMAFGHRIIAETDAACEQLHDEHEIQKTLEKANQRIVDELKQRTDKLLNDVLYITSMHMKNGFSRSDN